MELSGSPTPSSAHVKSFGPALLSAGVLSCQLKETCPGQHHLCAADGCLHLGLGDNVSRKPQLCGLWSSSLYCVGFGGLWALGEIWHCGAGSHKTARLVLLQPKDQSFRDQLSQLTLLDTVPIHSEYYTSMDLGDNTGLGASSGFETLTTHQQWTYTNLRIRCHQMLK